MKGVEEEAESAVGAVVVLAAEEGKVIEMRENCADREESQPLPTHESGEGPAGSEPVRAFDLV